MKKILLATLDFPPRLGGVGQYLYNVAKFFNKDIAVATTPCEGSDEYDLKQDFKIYRKPLLFKFFWPRHLKAIFVIKKIFKKERAQILAINDVLPLGYPVLILKLFFKIPYFVFLHGLDFSLAKRNCWKRFWLKKILKNAEFAVCNSRYLESEVKKLNLNIATLVVYPTPNAPSGLHSTLSIKKERVVFSLGRLIKRKGFDKLILAFDKVQEMIPGAVLTIAGKGPEERFLKNLAKKNENIVFVGKISEEEKWKFFDSCDIFALLAREINGDVEGFGIVYLEAACFGKPSVAGDVGGVSEAVLDRETGFVVNGENIDEIAEAIIKLLKDDELRKEMGEQARRRVIEEFSIEKQAIKIKDKI